MRVLQLIDSLRSGGAEQMAVNYANAIAEKIDGSYLCCTRSEGFLKEKLKLSVGYIFLKKKSAVDLKALIKLRKYILKNNIDIIHAHGTSWFFATALKITHPKLKLVWHDHYGNELKDRKAGVLNILSSFFDGIISVNSQLKVWSERELGVKNVILVNNFSAQENSPEKALLKGDGAFKIICVANFRPQKDHMNLLEAFKMTFIDRPEVSLHLVGKFEEDLYFNKIKKYLFDHQLEERVFLYGEQKDVNQLLGQAQMGILSSKSEGLPLALLEYGLNGLPTICTAVGECPSVLGNCGVLVEPGNTSALAEAMNFYYINPSAREKDRICFQKKVKDNYTENKVVKEVLQFYEYIMSVKGKFNTEE